MVTLRNLKNLSIQNLKFHGRVKIQKGRPFEITDVAHDEREPNSPIIIEVSMKFGVTHTFPDTREPLSSF